MIFGEVMQLKAWMRNESKKTEVPANICLQNYIMERFLVRVALSPYRENFIFKGGFLIAAMFGIGNRNTMDMDVTIKGVPVNQEKIYHVVNEIVLIDAKDNVSFEIRDIKDIHDSSEYDDFRISLLATFKTVQVYMKIDITTGDTIIPHEVEYPYRQMFDGKIIPIMAYPLNTILAEKIETILSRGVANTRARDFYDIYLLMNTKKDILSRSALLHAIRTKAEERESIIAIENYTKTLRDIADSPDIKKIWDNYTKRYPYATGIVLASIMELLNWVFETELI